MLTNIGLRGEIGVGPQGACDDNGKCPNGIYLPTFQLNKNLSILIRHFHLFVYRMVMHE